MDQKEIHKIHDKQSEILRKKAFVTCFEGKTVKKTRTVEFRYDFLHLNDS